MLFSPNTQALCLHQVSLRVLAHVGVRAIFLDADNTISTWNGQKIDERTAAWVAQAREMGFAVLIASNNNAQRLRPLCDALSIGCIGKAAKPLPFRLLGAAKMIGLRPVQCAMIGDQMLTDVLAGNLAGMHTVLLRPIDTSHEFAGTRINRRIEAKLKKWLKIAV